MPPRRHTLALSVHAPSPLLHAYLVQPTQTKWLRIDGFDPATDLQIASLCKFSAYAQRPDTKVYAYNSRRASWRVFSPDGMQPYEAWCMFPYLLSVDDVADTLAWGPARWGPTGCAALFKVPWSLAAWNHDFLWSLVSEFYTLDAWMPSKEYPVYGWETARLHKLELMFSHAHRMGKYQECFCAVQRGASIAWKMDVRGSRWNALRQYTQRYERLSVVFTRDLWAFRHWNVALRHVLPLGVRAHVARFLQQH